MTGEEKIIGGVLITGLVLFAGVVLLGAAGSVKELTEDLVYEESHGALHVVRVWEGDFSAGIGKLRKFHWRVHDLDDGVVTSGYEDTLDEAVAAAKEAVP